MISTPRRAPDATRADEIGVRDAIAVALLVVGVVGPLAALGANTSLLAALAALLHLAAALGIVLMLGPSAPAKLWGSAGPPAVCLFSALLWAGLGLSGEPRQDWAEAFRAAAGAGAHSLVPDDTALELVKLMSAAALGLAATVVGARARRLRLTAMLLAAAGGVYGLVSLGLHQNNPLEAFGVSKGSHAGRFTATLLNPNAAACVFAMLCVITTGLLSAQYNRMRAMAPALRARAWPALTLLLIVVFFFMGACALTKSRAGLIAALAGVALLLLLRRPPWGKARRTLSPKAAWALAAGLAAAVAISGAGALHRAGDLASAAADRIEAYQHYLELARQAPLTGYGLGAFPIVGLHGLEAEEAAHMWNFRAAHNAPLQAALEGGGPYLGFLAVGLALWAAAGLRPARPGARSIRLGFALAAGVAGACSLVDIALQVPAVAAFAAAAFGLSVGAGFEAAPEARPAARRGVRRRSSAAPSAA